MSFHAPYNFVPLSPHVRFSAWPDRTTHDIPLEDGYCGWMDICITAQTPIMVGDEGGREDTPNSNGTRPPREFFRLPDGTYAIPGATLRGLIRNVLEIATFGKFSQVDDTRFSVRDLTPSARHFYLDHYISTSGNAIVSSVKAGWLKFEEDRWRLWPCRYARIEQSDIETWLGVSIELDAAQTAVDKYRALHDAGRNVQLHAVAESFDHNKTFGVLRYQKITRLDPSGDEVYLVFTGQPESSNKHMEFVFYSPSSIRPVEVNDAVMREFLSIYGESDAWRYLHSANNPHLARGIPVFWLGGTAPTSLGLSQMYRLPYEFSVWDMVRHTSENHLSDQADFVETLFGASGEQERAGKGRVFFGDAVLDGEAQFGEKFEDVLNSPKPSYYPAYVRQKPDPHNAGKVEWYTDQKTHKQQYDYATYAKSPRGDQKPTLQGWKRYRARSALIKPSTPKDQENVIVRFIPLAEQSRFVGRVRLHNLRREEIGALIWALEWGGKENLRHLIGMAKSFGYGQVTIAITDWELRPNRIDQPRLRDISERRKLEQCFVDVMERWHAETVACAWKNSDQIRALLEMARPASAGHAPSDRNAGHMQLDIGGGTHPRRKPSDGNAGHMQSDSQDKEDFRNVKKEGLYLQPVPP